MAQKVGSGYVEIEPRVSRKDLRELQTKIKAFLEDTKFYIQPDVRVRDLNALRRKIADFMGLRPIYLRVDVRKSDITQLRLKIQEILAFRPVYINVDVSARDLLATRAKIQAALSGINVNVGTSGGGRGGRRGRGLTGFGAAGAGGALSAIANAFQLNGPIGGAAILAIAAAIAAAAVPLGAMLGGLVFSAIAAIPLAGAILIAVQDPKVGKAFTKLKDKFTENVTDPLKEEFGTTLAGIIDQFTEAIDRWTPLIQSILKAGMGFAQPIAGGIEDAIDVFLPGFDELINSKFIKRIMERLAGGFKIIADGFNEIFGDILNDPEAQAGFERGVTSFFNGVRIILVGVFDFLRWAARTWESWNIPDESGVTTVDRFKTMFGLIGDILKTLMTSFFSKENIDSALDSLNNILKLVDGIVNNRYIKELIMAAGDIGGLGGQTPTGNDTWDWFVKSMKEAINPFERFFDPEFQQGLKDIWNSLKEDWTSLTTSLKRQWEEFKSAVSGAWTWFTQPFVDAWHTIQEDWDKLTNYLSGGWDRFAADMDRELDEFIEPFKTAWGNISAGWNDLVGSLRGIWDGFFNWLTSKSSTVMAKATKTPSKGATNVAGKRFGGLMMASGGLAVGAGSGISDSIPAMISNGEFVVNAQATAQNMGLLEAINSGSSYQPNINVYVDGVAVAHRAVVSDALRSVTGYLTAGRGD